MDEAITPLLNRLTRGIENATDRAADENKLLSQAMHAFSWKWLWVASFATLNASAAGALILSGSLELAWHRSELESLRTAKAVMVESIAKLDKAKSGSKLSTCAGKPCIEVDTKQAYGDEGRYKFYLFKN
ncbi:MAG: hypothetical protein EXR80_08595 [Methylococcales bacterium]|nr:hypothetical protein [Methylococcales bacterium]